MSVTVSLAANAFVTKAEARDYVFTRSGADEVDDTDEDVLYRLVNAVCSAIERHLGKKIIIQEVTEYHDGGHNEIFLRYYPVSSITSVTENGTVLDADDYVFYDDIGLLARVVDGADSEWYDERRSVAVVYQAGYGTQTVANGEVTAIADVPEDIRLAALSWLRTIWKTEPENFSAQVAGGVVIRPHRMPAEVAGLLEPYVGRSVR